MNETMVSAIRFALDIALKATLLFSFTAVVIGLLRRSGAAARHFAGTAGLIAALTLPLLTLALPRWEVRVLPDLFKSSRVIPVSTLTADVSEGSFPASEPRWETVRTSAKETGSPVTPVNPPGRSVPWPLVALAAWTAGILLVGARLALGILRVHRIRLEAAPIRDSEWTEETRRLSHELELDRPVELLESARVPVAMTSGLLRPLLLLCRQARLWEVERRRVVLLHELAHVRRGDWLWLLLAEAAFAFYWWHPLAWALERQVRRDCERACDDLVLAAGTKPSVYAGHLLGIFRSLSAAAHPVAPAVASERTSHFEGRLRAILDPGPSRRDLPRGRALVSATGLFAAAAVIAVVQPWTPVCAHAAIQSFSTDGEETLASPAATARATSPACKQFKKAKPKPAGRAHPVSTSATSSVTTSATTTSTTAFAKTCASETTSASPSASEEDVAPAEPLPESGRTVPAILKAIGAVKEAASGFVRASNQGHGKGARDGSDWYSRGMSLHRRERYDEAIGAFQKAIEAGYREDAASYNIACGYALKGDRDKAFEWLRRAEEAGFEVASYLGHDDDLDGLKSDPRWKAMKAAVEQHPSARQEREAAAAVKRYERIAAGPGSGEAYYDVGKELLDAGRFDLSARAFQNAADRGYRVGTSLYNEACALSRAGQTRAALDLLQKSLDSGFDQPDIFARDDDLDNVRDDPRFAAIQREARDLALPGYNSWLLGSSRNRSKWRDAARKFEEYARAHPQKGRAWFNLGFASLAGDRPEAATEAFQKALELNYRKPTTMYNLACSYARLDQKDAAFDWLFKALDAGFDASGTLRGDEDLDNLRGDPRFRKALTIARAREQAEDD